MTNARSGPEPPVLKATLDAANVLLRVAARSVLDVQERVTSPQLRVLVLIGRHGPQPPGAIASELAIHPSNATRLCSRLERAGLIGRLDESPDKRVALFSLTAEGNRLVDSVLASRAQAIETILGRLAPDEQQLLLRAFDTFATAAADHDETTDGLFDLVSR